MNHFKCFPIILFIIISLAVASEKDSASGKTDLKVMKSEYVSFMSSGISVSKDALQFAGTFIVLGKGIYGHFDMVAYDQSGKVILQTKTNSMAYRKDNGPNVKSVSFGGTITSRCTRVEVSFHEMRLHPDKGACISK